MHGGSTLKEILVTKADGTREPFDIEKLHQSLLRAGTPDDEIDTIAREILKNIRPGIATSELYRHAFALLRKRHRINAERYSMRRALFELGPTGFPFEELIAEMFRAQGFSASRGIFVKGKCAMHELDLVAEKKEGHWLGEIKFHNQVGIKTDLKVALYVKARFDDIALSVIPGVVSSSILARCLITNTKFTTDAISYGECAGLTLISWDYPHQGNLLDLIHKTGVYPITALTTLSRSEKQRVLSRGVGLCKTVAGDATILRDVGIPEGKITTAVKESQALCSL